MGTRSSSASSKAGSASSPIQHTAANTSTLHKSEVKEIKRVAGDIAVSGVSLNHLIQLAETCSSATTVAEFVEQHIKPKTINKKESYLEMLAREKPHVVNDTAEYFVSYVWAYNLHELINALKYTLLEKTGAKDVFVWMDAFCVNQHQVGKKKATPEELQETFGESLKAIGKMAMVLQNWKDPSYPKRIWCVFEAYMSKASGTEVLLAMSLAEEKSLADAMVRNEVGQKFLNALFGSVNVEKAKATVAKDEETILRLIREFGVAEVNAVVLGNLKQWIVLGGELALKNLDADSEDAGNVYMARFAVHKALGEFDAALEWVDKTLAIDLKVQGPEHSETATTLNNRAECLKSLGRFEDALPVYDQAINIWTNALGPDHPQVAIGLNNRAECLRSLRCFDEALPVYEQAINIWTKALGPDHPQVATGLNNRALGLSSLGRFEEALLVYDQSLAIRLKVYGPDHPAVATALNNRAECLSSLGRFDEALPICDQALTIDMKVYGPDHPDVATGLNNRAWCLKGLRREEEAKSVGKQALAIRERVLGPDHPLTVSTRKDWGG